MMPLNHATPAFEQRYASHLKHLQLQGLQPKKVDAYARAIRTMGEHFDWQIDTLSAEQPATGHRHGAAGPGRVCRHPHPELPRVLLHRVQPGLAAQ